MSIRKQLFLGVLGQSILLAIITIFVIFKATEVTSCYGDAGLCESVRHDSSSVSVAAIIYAVIMYAILSLIALIVYKKQSRSAAIVLFAVQALLIIQSVVNFVKSDGNAALNVIALVTGLALAVLAFKVIRLPRVDAATLQ